MVTREDFFWILALLVMLAILNSQALPVEDKGEDELEAELKKVYEEVEKLRHEHTDTFTTGDLDNDGNLSPSEFFAIQKKEDPNLSQKDLEEAFSDHDKDGSGLLSLPEWQQPFEETVQSMLGEGDELQQSEEEKIAEHRKEFNALDTDGDGNLEENELEILAKHVTEGHTADGVLEHGEVSATEVLKALDTDQNGKVSFEEYVLDGALEGDAEVEEELGAHDLSLDDLTS